MCWGRQNRTTQTTHRRQGNGGDCPFLPIHPPTHPSTHINKNDKKRYSPPYGSLAAASAMVAICERSPHSARNVRVKACVSTRDPSWWWCGWWWCCWGDKGGLCVFALVSWLVRAWTDHHTPIYTHKTKGENPHPPSHTPPPTNGGSAPPHRRRCPRRRCGGSQRGWRRHGRPCECRSPCAPSRRP